MKGYFRRIGCCVKIAAIKNANTIQFENQFATLKAVDIFGAVLQMRRRRGDR